MSKDLFKFKREFLEYCELEKGQSILTINNYDRYLSKFLTWLKTYKFTSQKPKSLPDRQADETNAKLQIQNNEINLNILPKDVDQEAVRQYRLYVNRLNDRKGKELKVATQNFHMLALRAFLRYLSFRGIGSLSPEKVSIAKAGDREINFLEGEEIEQILIAANGTDRSGLRDRAILEVLFSTGLRVSELVGLKLKSLNLNRGEMSILGKGKKLRVVFLSKDALYWLDQYVAKRGIAKDSNGAFISSRDEPLFASVEKRHVSVRTVERIVSKYATRAGITKKVSPHTFRHSYATDLLISGADIRSVQSLLGHSSITTTQVYTHVTDQHLREVHEAFHRRRKEE